jgi:peroxiredoxin-like protein
VPDLIPADERKGETKWKLSMNIESRQWVRAGRVAWCRRKGFCLRFRSAHLLSSAGEPGRWTPEHFLVAAVASCFVSTFSGIAEKSHFALGSFHLDAEGVLANEEGMWRFTEIKLWPVVTILKEEDRERATRLLEKAGKSCLIARSVQSKVVLFPAVEIERGIVPAGGSVTDLGRKGISDR